MKILLTGYGPFGEHTVNPSWQAVKTVFEHWNHPEHQLKVQEVPVSYSYVQSHIPSLLKDFQPNIVIHVGVGFAGSVSLETCAHSTGYSRHDIDDCCGPVHGECVCLQTTLDIDKIISECCKNVELNIVKSVNAGRYLCEYIYYTSMQETLKEGIKRKVLFVHVPPLTEMITLDKEQVVLEKVIQCCIEQGLAE